MLTVGFSWGNLGLCIDFYTTVLLPLAMILKYYAPEASCGIQLGDLRAMNQVFHDCATTAGHDFKIFFSCGIHLGDLRIMYRVLYHCATTSGHDFKIFCFWCQ
jgi:hypothetical protein